MSDIKAPKELTFVLADEHGAYLSLVHQGEKKPYDKRTVTIELTEEQRKEIERRYVGTDSGEDKYEKIHEVIVEPMEDDQ